MNNALVRGCLRMPEGEDEGGEFGGVPICNPPNNCGLALSTIVGQEFKGNDPADPKCWEAASKRFIAHVYKQKRANGKKIKGKK